MAHRLFVCLMFLCVVTRTVLPEPTATSAPPATPSAEPRADDVTDEDPAAEEPPEGYYAFVESPNATPPRVRPPPYRQVSTGCPGAGEPRPHVSAHNLCGDLNRGLIPLNPLNPLGQNPQGEPYPFELIRNQTLRFLSRTLPVLRADDTLPRVKHLPASTLPHYSTADLQLQGNRLEEASESAFASMGRSKRSSPDTEGPADAGVHALPSHALRKEHRSASGDQPRESRKFCDGGGVFCMLYRAINGDSESPAAAGGAGASVERREDPGAGAATSPHTQHPAPHHRYEGPPTPCPARVEYATPVFARNYQGVWRYVVQIPYEGYFTQTVEVTRCMQSRCHYLEGGCLSSPRWVSLLVAELHYPPAAVGTTTTASAYQGQDYQQYIQNRAGQAEESSTDKPLHCDGHDELGCFQVRLYYDWFLVPGSCKCWRPDYFARYVRRRQNNEL